MPEPLRPSEVLATQVKLWRQRQKLSAQALANLITESGGKLGRVAISKIEVGERGVSLDEWLQLAHALAVPPPLLFCDLGSGHDVAINDDAILHPWLVWEWVVGDAPPTVSNRGVVRVEKWRTAQLAIRLYRRERKAADLVNAAQYHITAAGYADDEDGMRTARAAHIEALRNLAEVLDEMVEHDMVPPGKPPTWIQVIRDLNLSRHPDRLQVFIDEGEDDAA